MAATFKKYGDATIYHYGPGNAEYPALVLGARYDSGVKLGPDGEPALTLAYLNPATPQNGPLRGNLLDAVLVVHDVPYLATDDLTAVGYSDDEFDYPVPVTPTIEEQLASAQSEITALKAKFEASQPAVPVKSVEPVKPATPVPVKPAAPTAAGIASAPTATSAKIG